jgi:hypothetical protein
MTLSACAAPSNPAPANKGGHAVEKDQDARREGGPAIDADSSVLVSRQTRNVDIGDYVLI